MAPKVKLVWTDTLDRRLIEHLRAGVPKKKIAFILGIHRVQVLRRISALGIDEDELRRDAAVNSGPPDHLMKFKRARRGFHVPSHLEPAYYDLLKQGLSIDEVRKRLGITRD